MSVLAAALTRLRLGWSRCAMLLLLLTGHLSAGLFVSNLDQGLSHIHDPDVRELAAIVHQLFACLTLPHGVARLAGLTVVLLVVVRQIRGHAMPWFVDLFGAVLLLRCSVQFVLLNLLLLAPMRAGALLLTQLVLFLPVITIAFGWLYWRLDSGARRKGRAHIRFAETEQTVDRFNYFYLAGNTLLSFEPGDAVGCTRLMKSLFLLHGVVMLDLVALTLSRAIALAGGGG